MADRVNQHFVPQFFFRLFNGGSRFIHVMLRNSGDIHLHAPIKGQCAKPRFYGHRAIEDLLSTQEAWHAATLRKLVRFAWDSAPSLLSTDLKIEVLYALLLQRNRTEHEGEKLGPTHDELLAQVFRKFVTHLKDVPNQDKVLRSIDAGEIKLEANRQVLILQAISLAFELAPLLADLRPVILLNRTSAPFVFSDAPVVFINTYYRKIKERGVLGLQTPGLQVVFPLDPRTAIMLLDDGVYDGAYLNSTRVDVTLTTDVFQLNALQLHHSLKAVYFTAQCHQAYLHALWTSVRDRLTDVQSQLSVRRGWTVDGEPVDELLQMFEPQIPHHLDLSFAIVQDFRIPAGAG